MSVAKSVILEGKAQPDGTDTRTSHLRTDVDKQPKGVPNGHPSRNQTRDLRTALEACLVPTSFVPIKERNLSTIFYVHDAVYYMGCTLSGTKVLRREQILNLFTINKQLHNEVMDVLYSKITVQVQISPWFQDSFEHCPRIGFMEEMTLWRSVRNLNLKIWVGEHGSKDLSLQRLRKFITVAMDCGKHLQAVKVELNLTKEEKKDAEYLGGLRDALHMFDGKVPVKSIAGGQRL